MKFPKRTTPASVKSLLHQTAFMSVVFAQLASAASAQDLFPTATSIAQRTLPGNGAIDPTFNVAVTEGPGYVNKTVVQPDGKILVAGQFQMANGVTTRGLARFNADGTRDTTFATGSPQAGRPINTVTILPDGKLLIGAQYTFTIQLGPGFGINTFTEWGWSRINADGTFDSTFPSSQNNGFERAGLNSISDMLTLPSGLTIIAGEPSPTSSNSSPIRTYVSNFAPVFTPPSINGAVRSLAAAPDNKIVIGGTFSTPRPGVARLNADGSLDSTFNLLTGGNGAVSKVAVQPDGKVIVGGTFSTFNGAATDGLIRLNANGTVDTTFEISNDPDLAGMDVASIAVRPDGKILAGYIHPRNPRWGDVVLFNADGSRDVSFDTGSNGTLAVLDLNLRPDGSITAGGNFVSIGDRRQVHIARLTAAGAVDTSFNAEASSFGSVKSIKWQRDGKILIGGEFEYVNGVRRSGVARLHRDGSVDTSFNAGTGIFGVVHAVDLLPDGKIAIGGRFDGNSAFPASNAARLNNDGSFDINLNTANNSVRTAYAIAAQPGGKIVIGGQIRNQNDTGFVAVRRVNTNGSTDDSLNPIALGSGSNNDAVRALLIQPTGKIIIGGNFPSVGGGQRNGIARLLPDGSLDSGFSITEPGSEVSSLRQAPYGKVYAAGRQLRRYSVDGTIERQRGLTAGGFVDVAVHGQKVTALGQFNHLSSLYTNSPRVVRFYTRDMQVDPFFNTEASNVAAYESTLVQPDGKVLIGGQLTNSNLTGIGVVRFQATSSASFDYDGDGKSDISVYRPGDNGWYIRQPGGGFRTQTWGAAGDLLAPADFDIDRKTDLAVFRPSTGQWFVVRSSNNTILTTVWGESGDLPVPSDNTNDGFAEFTVYRQSTGQWFSRYTHGAQEFRPTQTFGVAGDRPMQGDFDGDGSGDIAVFRPSNNTWYAGTTWSGMMVDEWGEAGDVPVPADYDGDFLTDRAVYRPSTGQWLINRSTEGWKTVTWGEPGDQPAPADYDGDQTADPAVFRPSTGTWHIVGSLASIQTIHFGQNGDLPTPSSFIY